MRKSHSQLISLLLALLSVSAIHCYAQSMLTRHVHQAVRNGQAQSIGNLPADQIMNLNIVLPLRDPAGLNNFLAALYDPHSASYRHFLTVSEFTERFGPTQAQYDAVVNFAKLHGFTVIGGSRDGMNVEVRGPVSAVETAFNIHMRTFQHPTDGRTFYSPDSEPRTDLSFDLWHVSGLDNFSIPHPMLVKKSDYAQANGIDANKVVSHATTGSGPSASFLGSDMRAAYYGNGPLNGSGQNLGLLEYYGTDLADLNTYFSTIGQTNNVPITLLSTDGTSTSCVDNAGGGNCDDTEQTLDMTQAIGMAPRLASLVMYIGSTDTAIIGAMTSHNPLPTTIGCSWGWTPADPNTLDPYFQRMAAQGQNFFAASGDNSTWTRGKYVWPADDAYVVSVGGTDLMTASAGGSWLSETAWVDSGGGISPDNIAIPSWQQLSGVINSSNRGSTTWRNGPDVSANANFTFYTCADQTSCNANYYGGTSFAAPMWAGYIALVNQQLTINNSNTPTYIGFLNPTIYAQNVTPAYTTNFHDITNGTSGSYSAVTGYDLVTGWGSPNAGLMAALTGGTTTSSPSFTLSASPASVSIVQGSSGSSTITSQVSGGFSNSIALSYTTSAPSGVSVSFAPPSITGAGSSTATINVGSGVASGTYSITVTGTSGSLTGSTTISLTVTSAAQAAFSVSASPTAITVARRNSGTSTITTNVSGGFSSSITLTASGQGNNQVTFSPSSTIGAPGSGSSTMRVTVGGNASLGTRTITITGKGGGITHTTTVTLTVTR